ncbi:MAG: LysE family transporter [Bacteroidales bacterium]|jgi:threonine/homoserine/homoserine lactone efflux protein|nr:LysE family transporter [Bacteroidales bacterium]
MFEYLIAGITLGFVAGISPGPLLVLVITETIKYNRKEGIKIALIPLISDLPIVLFSVFVVFKLSSSNILLGIISLLGTIFLLYLAWDNIKTKAIEVSLNNERSNTLKKGIIANFLSPHPYLFWMLVGAPLSIKAYNQSLIAAVLFVAGFYVFIVGTKIAIAFVSDKSKNILTSKSYIIIVKTLGFVLLIFAIILIVDGFKFLNAV